MIDVHIIHMPGERHDWWEECERSLENHPITIHHINGVVGDVRQARLNGYRLGNHEYVSYVDPDDVVLPGAFESMLQELSKRPDVCGAYSLSNRMDHSGKHLGLIHPYREFSRDYLSRCVTEIHQLAVMRREPIIQTIQDNFDLIHPIGYTEITYFALFAQKYDWLAVDHVGYNWRVHSSGAHMQPHEVRQEALKFLRTLRVNLESSSA